jgi:hypothetical protein
VQQIHRNSLFSCGFQRPVHFSDPGFSHCEPIPVIYWLENMPNSYPFSLLEPCSKPHAFEAKVAPTSNSCPVWLGSDEVLAASRVSLEPTNTAPLPSSQVPPDWSFQKLPHKIPQRQFKCTYPGCDSQFRRRKAVERHMICHSDNVFHERAGRPGERATSSKNTSRVAPLFFKPPPCHQSVPDKLKNALSKKAESDLLYKH